MSTTIYCNRFSCTIIKYKPYYLYDNKILPGLEFTLRKSLSAIGSQEIYFLHKLSVYMHENNKASSGFVLPLIILDKHFSFKWLAYQLLSKQVMVIYKGLSVNSQADFLTKTKTKKIQQVFDLFCFLIFDVPSL